MSRDIVVSSFTPTLRGGGPVRTYGITKALARNGPLAVDASAPEVTVTARVTGDFPGSPVELQYRFTLEGASIAKLEITA